MPEEDVPRVESPHETVGMRLRHAREASGLSRSDIAAHTKIAERHLLAIEEDRFSDLASRTYAVGFSRAYARALELDEAEIADAVRAVLAESDESSERTQPASFEPGDPARVPGSRIAWLAALAAVGVMLLIFLVWRSFYSPAVSLPELTSEQEKAAPAPVVKAQKQAEPAGPVVFTALEPDIWVRFYDASGKQLMQKQMAKGERYTLPADADGPLVRTARPDALEITVGGRKVAPLANKPVLVADMPVSAAALLARTAPQPPAGSGVGTAASPTPAPPPSPRATATPGPRATPTAAPAPTRSAAPPSPKASPKPTPTATAKPAATATAKPKATPTPKPTATPTAKPAPVPTASPTQTRQPAPAAPAPAATPSPAAAAPAAPAEPSTVSE